MSRLRSVTVNGIVYGKTLFPEHPNHTGAWGLVGGEDVFAKRVTFRSIGEAMTWCRSVLDGEISPRWTTDGELLEPRTDVEWGDAKVEFSSYDTDITWTTDGRTWRRLTNDGRLGDVARTDPAPEDPESDT